MKTEDKSIKQMLNFDALSEAERITGESYKTDKSTESMGLLMHIVSGQMRREKLTSLGDSTGYEKVEDYKKIIESIGFEKIFEMPCKHKYNDELDTLYIYFQKKNGILLKWDTYNGNVNGGNYYYSWKPNGDDYYQFTSSGGFYLIDPNADRNEVFDRDDWRDHVVWNGDHDCREAIKFNIRMLEENGEFVTPWTNPPRLWLLTSEDTEGKSWGEYDSEVINAERIEQFPDYVKELINYNKR